MSDPIAIIDARGNTALITEVKVGGLSLLARHVRLLARARWAGLTIMVRDDSEHEAIERALAEHADGLAINVTLASAPNAEVGAVVLDACSVYTREDLANAARDRQSPRALASMATVGDVRAIEKRLFSTLRKRIEMDGVVAYYLMRPLSRLLSRALVNTAVTPNQVTLVAMGLGIAAALLAAQGSHAYFALAGILFWSGAAIDCVDGELARLRLQGSKLGEWLDTIADDVSTFGMLLGLGIGLARENQLWPTLGVVGALVGLATEAKLYLDLHRLGLTIDTAQYPWFFGQHSAGSSIERSPVGKLIYWLGYAFRRDAFVTAILVLLLFDLPKLAMLALLGGTAVMLLLLVLHLAVSACKRLGHR